LLVFYDFPAEHWKSKVRSRPSPSRKVKGFELKLNRATKQEVRDRRKVIALQLSPRRKTRGRAAPEYHSKNIFLISRSLAGDFCIGGAACGIY
jgi:hypothetical protein